MHTKPVWGFDASQCPGYELRDVKDRERGVTGSLKLAGPPVNAYGYDIKELDLAVEYETANRLHVHISDSARRQYQVPQSVLARPGRSQHDGDPDLQFHHTSSSDLFAFWITRRGGEVIFDTRPLNIPTYTTALCLKEPNEDNHLPPDSTPFGYDRIESSGTYKDERTIMRKHNLVFEDQYLQLSTAIPKNTNIYGLGEVIATSGLRRNVNGNVATMWNRDSGGSPQDETLYGSHPFYMEVREDENGYHHAHGVFMLNSHGMDVLMRPGVLQYRILGGTLDMYFISGPTCVDVIRQYAAIVGRPAQIPAWAFGYHMARWGGHFATLESLKGVVHRMREEGIPWETVWSDLDYMKNRRNWTFHPENFKQKDYKAFVDWLHSNNQHYVPLVDVAIGLDSGDGGSYKPYNEGSRLGVFLKNPDGTEFVGKVWPGPAVFPDWSHPQTTDWWQQCHDDYRKVVEYDGIWNDMNEPSSFIDGTSDLRASSRPAFVTDNEIDFAAAMTGMTDRWNFPAYAIHDSFKGLARLTVAPSSRKYDGSLHYHSHNNYGLEETIATRKVLLQQEHNKRPFILSRSSAPGTGHVCAHWLGDNYSSWGSMRDSVQGVLQFQIFSVPMVGPDAGGFGLPDATEELCSRWFQLAAFYPFFRNHSADNTANQEPFKWPSVKKATQKVINARYRMLPIWEDLFARAHKMGDPVVRPLFFEFPEKRHLHMTDKQFLVGKSILVTPVLDQGAKSVKGVFPSKDANGKAVNWRSWWSYSPVERDKNDQATLSAPMGEIPVHIRSGTILLTYQKSQYTTKETREGDFEVLVYLDEDGRAEGSFCLDDGTTIDGPDLSWSAVAENGYLHTTSKGQYSPEGRIASIKVLGVTGALKRAVDHNGDNIRITKDIHCNTLSDMQCELTRDASFSWVV